MTTPALAGADRLPGLGQQAGRTADEEPSRGRTTLNDRVVDKIAAQAALEVDHVHGASPGIAGSVFNADPTVGVTTAIDGHLAQLRLIVEVDYPISLRDVTRQLRRHVSERVRQLCDITVTDVDIRVTALRTATEPARRVL
jgi:uncharacterized alkaline shock family protein YloU